MWVFSDDNRCTGRPAVTLTVHNRLPVPGILGETRWEVAVDAEELLTDCDHALVALDGPIAELPGTRPAAERLRTMVAEAPLPRKVARTDDPFVVLAHAAAIGPATERALYSQLCRIEHEVLATARVTPGVREALAAMSAAGTQVTVISGLATAAVRSFLVVHGLAEHVHHLAGRRGPDRTGLPPDPAMITAAVHERAVERCVFVGSTEADLAAARAAGVTAVRHRHRTAAPVAEPAPPPPNPWFGALSAPARR
jgi:phosphoglycolate phosphatase-like HAD superfamily hydrolase